MDKIIEFFKQWDKLAHILVSMVTMLVFTALISLSVDNWTAIGFSSIICAIAALVKEAYDAHGGGVCSRWDLLADGIGWLIATLSLVIVSI